MANDSLRTPLCVTYRAEAVACGIIFTAARKLKVRSLHPCAAALGCTCCCKLAAHGICSASPKLSNLSRVLVCCSCGAGLWTALEPAAHP